MRTQLLLLRVATVPPGVVQKTAWVGIIHRSLFSKLKLLKKVVISIVHPSFTENLLSLGGRIRHKVLA